MDYHSSLERVRAANFKPRPDLARDYYILYSHAMRSPDAQIHIRKDVFHIVSELQCLKKSMKSGYYSAYHDLVVMYMQGAKHFGISQDFDTAERMLNTMDDNKDMLISNETQDDISRSIEGIRNVLNYLRKDANKNMCLD